jgi:hypothetical protein
MPVQSNEQFDVEEKVLEDEIIAEDNGLQSLIKLEEEIVASALID